MMKENVMLTNLVDQKSNNGARPEGLERIARGFARPASEGRAALMPYFTLGFPDPPRSLEYILAIARGGADLIELGIPFSDPLADGPTIQHSTHTALQAGMTVAGCLEQVAALRRLGVEQPLILMGYYNPILAFGVQRFVERAKEVGADGFIVPDLPPQEGTELEAHCRMVDLALVYMLAPTSPPERMVEVAARTRGFLYLVSLTGVTGSRTTLSLDLAEFIGRVRRIAQTPVAVGFGISTPEQAGVVGRLADGVIVGSALIEAIEHAEEPARAAEQFVSGLLAGIKRAQKQI